MICKTSLSNLFRGMPITNDFALSTIGMPITDKGRQIGVITYADPKTDTVTMEIDDQYKDEFIKTQSFEIVQN